jgi:hypothetical protein
MTKRNERQHSGQLPPKFFELMAKFAAVTGTTITAMHAFLDHTFGWPT